MADFRGSHRFRRVHDDGFPKEEKKRKTTGSEGGASSKRKEPCDGSHEGEKKSATRSLEGGNSSKDLPLKGELGNKTHRVSHTPSSHTHKKKEGSVVSSSSERVLTLPNTLNLDWLIPRDKGYTTVGFIFREGIYIAADHPYKDHVPNVIPIGPSMLAAISGASDSLLKRLEREIHVIPNALSVEKVSERMANFLLSVGEEGLSVEMLIGGLEKGGPALYYVEGSGKVEDCNGKLVYSTGEKPLFVGYATGSGYRFALSCLHVQFHPEFPAAMIERVAKNAICSGISDAVIAGSFVTVYHVDRDGWKKVISGDYVSEWSGNGEWWTDFDDKI